MNLKKVEIYGFKSFADKLEIKFEAGITAIVGPNGCGKSNVADAVRWVLGEQSAKLLRGKNMVDLIFNGTDKRKSLSYCEVALFFDNLDKAIPLDFNEVVIARKLYRSGESEYSVNKTVTRLKDIVDLLRDGGMGREGFSIIGQGKIDEILSAKPDDRRVIFEEAVGISKSKQRKTETERKLSRTRENLLSLTAVLVELERQLAPLKKQSEDAKKYLELKEQLKFHEINVFIQQYDNAASAKELIAARLNAISDELNFKQSRYELAFNKYEECINNITNADRHINELRDQVLHLTVGLEKRAGELKLNKERVNFLNEQNARLVKEISAATKQHDLHKVQLEQKGEKCESRKVSLTKLRDEAEILNNAYLELAGLINQNQDEVESSQKQVIESLDKLSDIRSNITRFKTESANLAEKIKDNDKKCKTLAARQKQDEASLVKVEAEIERATADKRRQTEKRNALSGEYNTLVSQLKTLDQDLNALNGKKTALSARFNTLAQIAESFEGYNNTVKRLLTDAKSDTKLSGKIEGVASALIKVPEKFESAIDVALGAAMQNIVVKTEDDAKYLIGYLKEKKYGRITFLPISSVRPRRLSDADKGVLKEDGCLGVASGLITFSPKYDNVYQGLLGSTVVATNLDAAILLSRKYKFSFKIVTLEGEVITAGGAITGGSKKAEAFNLLSADRERTSAPEDLKVVEKDIRARETLKTEIIAGEQRLEADIRAIGEKLHNYDITLASSRQICLELKRDIADNKTGAELLTAENAKLSERLSDTDRSIKSVDEQSSAVSTSKSAANSQIVKRQEQYDALKRKRDGLHEKIIDIKVSIASETGHIGALESDILRIEKAICDIKILTEEAERQLNDNNDLLKLAEDKTKGEVLSKDDELSLSEIKQKLSNLDSYKQQLEQNRNAADKDRTELNFELNKINDKKFKEEFNLSKIDSDIDIMQERVNDEYGLSYSQAFSLKREDYDFKKGGHEINKLKKEILSLGYINVNAIEDYKETSAIYDEKDTQRNDLTKAEADFQKIIAELTAEMASRFKTGFIKINENFQKIFKELFGGGHANLVLEESEPGQDPLDAGIEIQAEPPGKKLQSISLLSGGERAMTAIAILFAILKLRPMPFCVLDEIEASLDDANTVRFAKYLQKFARSTQFIVITHRKPTMELSDALYGVTMEEKGVSKMVSVKLGQATALAQ